MFWKKGKSSEAKTDQSKSKNMKSSVSESYRPDGHKKVTDTVITSFESKVKTSSKSSFSRTSITLTTSNLSNLSEINKISSSLISSLTELNSPKPDSSSSNISKSNALFQRQKTAPNIIRHRDATPFNSTYVSPYRASASSSPLKPPTIETTKVYQSPYRTSSVTTSISEKKSSVFSSRTASTNIKPTSILNNSYISANKTPQTVIGANSSQGTKSKTTTIWNPMTSSLLASSRPLNTAINSPEEIKTKPTTTWSPLISSSLIHNKNKAKTSPSIHQQPSAKSPVPNQLSKKKLSPGIAYIFHNDKFDSQDKEFRSGSVEDVNLLKKTFQIFKMQFNLYDNLTVKGITNVVRKIETKDFSKASCIVVVVLTHGTRYETVAARDGSYSIDDDVLFPILRNRTLRSKPKLLFIQACKGPMESGTLKRDAIQPHGTPDEILKCYSTFEGYVAYRTEKGSLFIQSLCELLQLYGNSKNIKEIMDLVIRRVKEKSEGKQIPSYETTLTEPYVFGDFSQ